MIKLLTLLLIAGVAAAFAARLCSNVYQIVTNRGERSDA